MNLDSSRTLPNRRWISRGVVLEFIDGTWRDLRRLEASGRLVPQYPAGLKYRRYLREQVLALRSWK